MIDVITPKIYKKYNGEPVYVSDYDVCVPYEEIWDFFTDEKIDGSSEIDFFICEPSVVDVSEIITYLIDNLLVHPIEDKKGFYAYSKHDGSIRSVQDIASDMLLENKVLRWEKGRFLTKYNDIKDYISKGLLK